MIKFYDSHVLSYYMHVAKQYCDQPMCHVWDWIAAYWEGHRDCDQLNRFEAR